MDDHILSFSLFTKVFKNIQIYLIQRDSNASILKAHMKPEGNVFIKIFAENCKDLLFEKQMYEYITNTTNSTNYSTYFVKLVKVFKISGSELKFIVQSRQYRTEYMFYGIVTKHYDNSMKLCEYFSKNQLNSENIKHVKRIIFDILYGIYILNLKLFIIHNDLHFGNIIYEENILEYSQFYKIEGKEFSLQKSFNVRIFDYDCSTKYNSEIKNTRLDDDYCKIYGSCNKYSQKDVYLIIVSLIEYVLKFKYTDLNPIINTLLDNNLSLKKAIIDNIKNERAFWSIFSSIKDNKFDLSDCSDTNFDFLDINKVIVKYMNKFKNDLQIK